MVLQECVLGIAREFQHRVDAASHRVLRTLWDGRRILPVLWQKRDVRINHWPLAAQGELVRGATSATLPPGHTTLCRMLVARAQQGTGATTADPHVADERTHGGLRDVGVQCNATIIRFDSRRHAVPREGDNAKRRRTTAAVRDDYRCLCQSGLPRFPGDVWPQTLHPEDAPALQDVCVWCVAVILRGAMDRWSAADWGVPH